MSTQDDLQRAVGELLAQERQNLSAHLEPEEIASYHGGVLLPEEEEQIQEHLSACPECTALLLDLETLADPSYGTSVSQMELSAAWRAVHGRLRQEAAGTPGPTSVDGRSSVGWLPWLYSLAATLLLAVGALTFRVISLERSVDELSRPQLNAPVLDLRPSIRGDELGRIPQVPSGARLFTLIINPVRTLNGSHYAVQILDTAGKRVWSGQGLEPNSFGSFSLTLSRRTLGEGEYRLQLWGPEAKRRELIGEYVFHIQAP